MFGFRVISFAKIQSLMAYRHSSVFNNFVTKIHLCCGAWSILQVVGRSTEAHLIVLMLEVLNLVLEALNLVLEALNFGA